MVTAFGFHYFTVVRVFVAFQSALAASTFHMCSNAFAGARVEQGDHVTQGVVIVSQQGEEFGFKLNFALELFVTLEGFEALLLLGDLSFQSFVFGNDRHGDS